MERDCEGRDRAESGESLPFAAAAPPRRLRSRRWRAVLAVVVALFVAFVAVNLVGRHIAAEHVRQAEVVLDSIDVGELNGSSWLRPHIRGRVMRPSAFDATFYPADASIRWLAGDEPSDIGQAQLPRLRVRGGEDLVLDFTVPFLIADEDVFSAAGKAVVQNGTSFWEVRASANVVGWLFGVLPVPLVGVVIQKRLALQGFGGFAQDRNPITMERLTSAFGSDGVLHVGVEVNLFNPSYLGARVVPELHLNISQRGKPFGVATIRGLRFSPGRNIVPVGFALQDNAENRDAVEAFILSYIRADCTEPVVMHGSPQSTEDPLIKAVLDGLVLQFRFKPPRTQFIDNIRAQIGIDGLSADAFIYNPLPADIVFVGLDIVIREDTAKGEDVFLLNSARSATQVPGQVLLSEATTDVYIKLSLRDAHLTDPSQLIRLLGDARRGRISVGVVGNVSITIKPSFSLDLLYSADGISCLLECPIWCKREDRLLLH